MNSNGKIQSLPMVTDAEITPRDNRLIAIPYWQQRREERRKLEILQLRGLQIIEQAKVGLILKECQYKTEKQDLELDILAQQRESGQLQIDRQRFDQDLHKQEETYLAMKRLQRKEELEAEEHKRALAEKRAKTREEVARSDADIQEHRERGKKAEKAANGQNDNETDLAVLNIQKKYDKIRRAYRKLNFSEDSDAFRALERQYHADLAEFTQTFAVPNGTPNGGHP